MSGVSPLQVPASRLTSDPAARHGHFDPSFETGVACRRSFRLEASTHLDHEALPSAGRPRVFESLQAPGAAASRPLPACPKVGVCVCKSPCFTQYGYLQRDLFTLPSIALTGFTGSRSSHVV